MQIGLYTDSVAKLSFEEALDFAVGVGVKTVEIATGGQSRAPHLRLDQLLASDEARKRWLDAITSRGLVLESLNCSAFPLHPRLGQEHTQIIRDTIRLAELLGVDSIVTQSGCPGDSEQSRLPHWIVYRWPPEYLEVLEWQWDQAIALWRDLAALARDHGVTKICFELHPLNLAYNVPTLLRLREAVGPHIGANLDPSHLMWQGMDIPACIKALGPPCSTRTSRTRAWSPRRSPWPGCSTSPRRARLPTSRGPFGRSATATTSCGGAASWTRCARLATTARCPSKTRTPYCPVWRACAAPRSFFAI